MEDAEIEEVGGAVVERDEEAMIRPMNRPGKLMASGRMRTRRSVMVRTMMRQMKKSHLPVTGERPKV